MSFIRFIKVVSFFLLGFLVFRVFAPFLIAADSTWLVIVGFLLMGVYTLYCCWVLIKFLSQNSQNKEIPEADFEIVDSDE